MPDLDLDRFLALPRLSGLRRSPDGRRIVVAAARVDPSGTRFASAVWAVDPSGTQAARRLTRSLPGEGSATFLRDGSLLFASSRPDPSLAADRREVLADVGTLWLLPVDGGEARPIAAPHGGIDGIVTAREADVILFGTSVHPGAGTPEEDEARESARTKTKVAARLFEGYPIRDWDHYLGPRERRLLTGVLGPDPETPLLELRDVAPDAGDALRGTDADLTPDGATIVTGWRREDELTRPAVDLVAIDRVTGARRTLAAIDGWHTGVRVAPDGRSVACVRIVNGVAGARGPAVARRGRPRRWGHARVGWRSRRRLAARDRVGTGR